MESLIGSIVIPSGNLLSLKNNEIVISINRATFKENSMRSGKLRLVALLIAFVPLSGFSDYFWEKPDPGATEAVEKSFPILDCGDNQHYVILGDSMVPPISRIYAVDLGPRYRASNDLEFEEREVSKSDKKNGLEKRYSFRFSIKDALYKKAVLYELRVDEVDKTWSQGSLGGAGRVELQSNGKWSVDYTMCVIDCDFQTGLWWGSQRNHWRNHWPVLLNRPRAVCEIFGL